MSLKPEWVEYSNEEIEDLIVKLYREATPPAK